MRCPRCKTRLRKEDVVVYSDFDMRSGKLLAKEAWCPVCGQVLGRRVF